jgi:ubiquinone/menaquinone biosynthesis C-methylase UbiE
MNSAKLTNEEIRSYWTQQAREHGQSPSASWSDHCVIEMEIREILRFLNDDDRVLDVGCANGYSSLEFARARRVSLRGLDYIPDMINEARNRSLAIRDMLVGSVEFNVGDIVQLQEPDDFYDKVVVVRVLINLGDWDRQLTAIRQCIRVLKPGGLLLLSEATLQGWRRLNKLRHEWGLDDIPMPSFNEYLDEEKIVSAITGHGHIQKISNFASSYYVGTRVIKPLLAKVTNAPVDAADPNAEWNRFCSHLVSAGDYGTQKLFIIKKLQ